MTTFFCLGRFWTHLDHFEQGLIFCPKNTKCIVRGLSAFQRKINILLKWSHRIQVNPKGSKMIKSRYIHHVFYSRQR